MALDEIFASAYIDNSKKHRILGVQLKPFCAWHLWLLQAIDSPFLRTGEVTPFDLRVALGICRLHYRKSKVKKAWWPMITQKQFQGCVARFMAYIADYLNRPEYNIITPEPYPGSKPPRQTAPPPEIIMLVFDAAHGARVPLVEAWNMPIGEAYIAQAMFMRQQGAQLDFMNQEERLFQRELIEAGIK